MSLTLCCVVRLISGVFVPILILVFGYAAGDAVPLSNAMVVGVGITNIVQVAGRRHPNADRPLIDYWLAMVMVPLMLVGTVFGVLLNTMFPDWLVLVILVLVLGITVYRTIGKGLKTWRKEHAAAQEAKLSGDTKAEPKVQLVELDG